MRKITTSAALALLFSITALAQPARVNISLSESFFDAFLDSVFTNFDPPQFPIAAKQGPRPANSNSFAPPVACVETIKILRETNGVRTAVRFREGKVYLPIAFSGSYAAPFVGCVDFAGVAEADLTLEFEQGSQRLLGRANVYNVNLNGSGGVGGSLIAKMLQSSIDKKLNPLQILDLEKLSFLVPVRGSGSIKLKAIRLTPEVSGSSLNIAVDYSFQKE